jgi:hypothetical protein
MQQSMQSGGNEASTSKAFPTRKSGVRSPDARYSDNLDRLAGTPSLAAIEGNLLVSAAQIVNMRPL